MVKIKDSARKATKPPIKTERIGLDDFTVEVDGSEYHPHENEWVEIAPIRQLSSLKNLLQLAQMDVEGMDLKNPQLIQQYDGLTRYLSDVIHSWNLTDDEGNELPSPYKNPAIIECLDMETINYLVAKLIGGRTDDSKSPVGENS